MTNETVNPVEKLAAIENPEGEYLELLSTAARMTDDDAPVLEEILPRTSLNVWEAEFVLGELESDGFEFFRTPQSWIILKEEMPREQYNRLINDYQNGLTVADRAKMYALYAVAGVGVIGVIIHFLWENRDKIGIGIPGLTR